MEPMTIAAIAAAAASVLGSLMGGKPKEHQLQQGTFGMPGTTAGGAAKIPEDMVDPKNVFYRSGGQDAMQNQMFLDAMMSGFDTEPRPKFNERIQKVDEGPVAATMDFKIGRDDQNMFRPLTGSPPQVNRGDKGAFQLFPTGPQTAENRGPGDTFGLGLENISTGTKKSGFDADKTLQYAAMAATLGSLLNAGGPPRPPALPGGGRFDAAPTSMRFLYGG